MDLPSVHDYVDLFFQSWSCGTFKSDDKLFSGKCASTYCSTHNNGQYINNIIDSCCTFGSASECSCCLPKKDACNTDCHSGCTTDNLFPTWKSCVNDWSNCCLSWKQGYVHPRYEGVDWVLDASCCQLCNGRNWDGD
eukprot:1210815-Ditylum_brightwellii.AAC.1